MNMTRTRILAVIGAAGIAALALSGCSSSPADSAAAEPARESGQNSADPQPRGVSGEIAAASDGLLQVQDAQSQTAVSYTADTGITREVAAQLSDVAVGVCVTGIGGGESSEALTGVTISEAVDGACASGPGGRGGAGGEMPEGFEPPTGGEAPEGLPEGAEPPEDGGQPADGERPEGMPEGMAPGGPGGFSTGIVTAVDETTITIDAVAMDGETSPQELVVDDATAFTRVAAATSEALATGACVVATGEYDGDRYAATSLAVSEPGEDGCNAGFGGLPGRGADDE